MSALPLETPFEDEAERFTPYSYAAIVPQRGETYAAQAADIAEQIRRQFKGSGRKIVRQNRLSARRRNAWTKWPRCLHKTLATACR